LRHHLLDFIAFGRFCVWILRYKWISWIYISIIVKLLIPLIQSYLLILFFCWFLIFLSRFEIWVMVIIVESLLCILKLIVSKNIFFLSIHLFILQLIFLMILVRLICFQNVTRVNHFIQKIAYLSQLELAFCICFFDNFSNLCLLLGTLQFKRMALVGSFL
jgi:hypothetical protein